MTKPVFVDKHVLRATADALADLAADLPGLLDAADGLDVGGEVAQLRAAPTWASETALDLRARIQALVEAERVRTAEALGERSDAFMKLKVEGINDCAELLVAALMDNREPHIFGRRTLPEMDLASLACAIQNL